METPIKNQVRYTDSDGFRKIMGVLIPIGTRVEKFDGEVWVYLDTLPPKERLKNL